MKIATNIAGGLLGFIFVALSLMVLLGMAPKQTPLPGSPAAAFMDAFVPTGWFIVVKICELVGGILVAIPKTRNLGLLALGPIVVNILCFHVLVMKGAGLMGPPLIVALLAAFLLFAERKSFAALIH
jgi:putative oxidoreductase